MRSRINDPMIRIIGSEEEAGISLIIPAGRGIV